jgi:CRISPR system Cascade subunit CasB
LPPSEPKQHPLVTYLKSLVEQDDRASLAALRSALRPGRELEALRFVVPFLATNGRNDTPLLAARRRRDEDDAILLASLFALYPENGGLSLASAMSKIFHDTQSESIEGRFRALLSAHRNELDTHLRNAVSLCASKNLPLDWNDLYLAIRRWDSDEEQVRRAWARDFWAFSASTEAPTADAST